MFSNKENINILTALLVEHGVEHVVVCPGSRNAPIVHNMSECPEIICHPVTDERSAGFYALGIAQATGKPVAVCVTSGTALLNLAPAVAEAYYQHQPVVVVSADRPQEWIGQLDGQTLPQPGALGCFVRKAVTLPEPCGDDQRWYCNRLVNEALCMAVYRSGGPVHINVPVSEPLFGFTVEALPEERVIRHLSPGSVIRHHEGLEALFRKSARPMIVIGYTAGCVIDEAVVGDLSEHFVVIHEPLGCSRGAIGFDEVLYAVGNDRSYMPDFVLYAGGTLVSKRMRAFLREAAAPTCLLTTCGSDMPDPTMRLTDIVECGDMCDMNNLLHNLVSGCGDGVRDISRRDFHCRWYKALCAVETVKASYEPCYSQMAAVKYLEEQLEDIGCDFYAHYANSSSVRLACIYAGHYVWCNRGVNGIDGSLSTAAGFSLSLPGMMLCVIGDLSFFYDQNALWNTSIGGNLRILLLNNHCGGIFHQLRGLECSSARDTIVAASHHTEARGICTQNDIGYMAAHDMDSVRLGIVTLLTRQSSRPMLLEVFTSADDDKNTMQAYYREVRLALGRL